jgi:lauroyl/myristoyl acyltransferase
VSASDAPEPALGPGVSPIAGTARQRDEQIALVLEGNLRRVIGGEQPDGQLRALSRQAMRSYARYWLEIFRLPVMPAERLAGGMHNSGHLQAALE